jgi:hypothetical protein
MSTLPHIANEDGTFKCPGPDLGGCRMYTERMTPGCRCLDAGFNCEYCIRDDEFDADHSQCENFADHNCDIGNGCQLDPAPGCGLDCGADIECAYGWPTPYGWPAPGELVRVEWGGEDDEVWRISGWNERAAIKTEPIHAANT